MRLESVALFLCALVAFHDVHVTAGVAQVNDHRQERQTTTRTPMFVENAKKTIQNHFFDSSIASNCSRQNHGRGTEGDLTQRCPMPTVPGNLFQKRPFCRQGQCQKRETCLVIAENILDYFGSFDVVLLHADACSQYHTLAPGNLTRAHVNRMIPIAETLVSVRLNATDLMRVILQGVAKDNKRPKDAGVPSFLRDHTAHERTQYPTCKQSPIDRFPILAGVKFDITTDRKTGRKGIFNVRVMSDNCKWVDLDMQASYSILTTESLALGDLGYGAMTSSHMWWSTGQTVRDAFWRQARSTCSLRVPHLFSSNPAGKDDAFLNGDQFNERKRDIVRKSNSLNASHITRWVGGQASF